MGLCCNQWRWLRGGSVPKKGLSKESVVQAAIRLIEEKGIEQFSMAKLAQAGTSKQHLYTIISIV